VDIIQLLPEYLDLGVDQEELVAVTQAALAKRVRDLKLAIAEAVVQARACTLLDNLEGSHQALQRARQLQREYHHFYAEWTRLQVPPHPELAEPPQNGAGPEVLQLERSEIPIQSGPQLRLRRESDAVGPGA
jgi:hypothetical protein